MNFVDEENHLASGLLHLFHHRLEALLELATELGPSQHATEVQGHHAPVLEAVGHVVGRDALGQGFGDGGFADTRLTDHDGVVLFAAGQGLHQAAHFVFASNHGIKLSLSRQGCEVNAVALQGSVLGLGPRVGDAAGTPDLHQRLVHLLLFDAVCLEDGGGLSLLFQSGGDEDVLGADVFVVQALRFQAGVVHEIGYSWRAIDLIPLGRYLGRSLQGFSELAAYRVGGHTHLAEDLHRQAVFNL